jgi:hypothetical protein
MIKRKKTNSYLQNTTQKAEFTTSCALIQILMFDKLPINLDEMRLNIKDGGWFYGV